MPYIEPIEDSTTPKVETEKPVILVSSEGNKFEISRKAACLSRVLYNMIEDFVDTDFEVPLSTMDDSVVSKVIEFLEYHKDDVGASTRERDEVKLAERIAALEKPYSRRVIKSTTDIKQWDYNFFEDKNHYVFCLMLAANFLDIDILTDLTIKMVANMVKGRTPAQIRQSLGLEYDLTPQMEEEIYRQTHMLADDEDIEKHKEMVRTRVLPEPEYRPSHLPFPI